MTDPADPDLRGGWEAAAAEYALGLLPEAEKPAFEARLTRDPELRDELAAWETYFATLADAAEPVSPPPQVFRRIESDLFPAPRRSVWRGILPYVLGAVTGALVTWAVFSAGLLAPTGPELRADLAPVEGEAAFAVRFDAQTGLLAIDAGAGALPQDGALELWLIAGEAAPVSLGLLAEDGTALRPLPPILADRLVGATLAVSSEPAGGSPTGAPTGPVLAAGQVTEG